MKRCAYCGREYPDDTAVCLIDRTPLENPAGAAEESANNTASAPSDASKSDANSNYSGNRWSARDGWKFVGMSVLFTFALAGLIVFLLFFADIRISRAWTQSAVGQLALAVIYAAICVLTAAYFSRTKSLAAFCEAVGLYRKPTNHAWFGIATVFGLVLLSHVVYALGWAKGHATSYFVGFRNTPGPERILFLLPLTLSPFWEEIVNRGFLYKAFRGSYSAPASTILLIGYTALTHSDRYYYFGLAAITLSVLTMIQCYLREKSDSIWDCILCHLMFNISGLFVSGVLR